MKKRSLLKIETDDHGHILLPVEIMKRYGISSGAVLALEEHTSGLHLSHSTQSLARIYIEPTNQCNLDCVTCMRNAWDEPSGKMSWALFDQVLKGIQSFLPTPSVFFGGYGEPLTHPGIVDMVAQAHQAGAVVELITNGILLKANTLLKLTEAGLHRVWVSIDGATPQGYADVRLGAALPEVISNLQNLLSQRERVGKAPHLGIAVVAMKRNLSELPEIIALGRSLGADRFSISNVYPHTAALRDEILYSRSLYQDSPIASEWAPRIDLPRMDLDTHSADILTQILSNRLVLAIARQDVSLGIKTCPFAEKASLSVRWDGAVSPCLALLHDHESYLDDRPRHTHAYQVGHLLDQPIKEIWEEPAYIALRQRLLQFDYSPCTYCNSCNMALSNLEDCFGNVQPACGGCLWAQGFIQCP